MKHLLVNCDLGWVDDFEKFENSLNEDFNDVTILDLGSKLRDFDLSTVTHWIMNPAPYETVTLNYLNEVVPRIRVIGSPSTGTTHIDEIVKGCGSVRVYCLKDAPKSDLARITSSSEHTLFLFLSLIRKSWECLRCDLTRWRCDLISLRGKQIQGMRVLIFGYGRIGSNLARYLTSMGAEILVYDPALTEPVDFGLSLTLAEVPRYLSEVDAVFLCFHWSPGNTEFFSRYYLECMRKDAFLINTSRGENLDESALTELLQEGKFAGVALDVLSGEQGKDFSSHPLIQLQSTIDRLIITPHIAGASNDSEKIAFDLIYKMVLL